MFRNKRIFCKCIELKQKATNEEHRFGITDILLPTSNTGVSDWRPGPALQSGFLIMYTLGDESQLLR